MIQPSSPPPAAADAAVADALARAGHLPGGLLQVLHAIKDRLGHVPPESLPRVADALNLSLADVHGVVSYYHDFRTRPPGRHVVKVCRAEACQSVGCENLVRELESGLGVAVGETRADGAVSIESVYCLGNCALGPSAMIDGELHGRVTADVIAEALRSPPLS